MFTYELIFEVSISCGSCYLDQLVGSRSISPLHDAIFPIYLVLFRSVSLAIIVLLCRLFFLWEGFSSIFFLVLARYWDAVRAERYG